MPNNRMRQIAAIILNYIFYFICSQSNAQTSPKRLGGMEQSVVKKSLDLTIFSKWQSVLDDGSISNNGNYILCSIKDEYDSLPGLFVYDVKAAKGELVNNVIDAKFTSDDRSIVFLGKNDSLFILYLNAGTSKFIETVTSFGIARGPKEDILVYIRKENNALVIRNLSNAKEEIFDNVADYLISPDGETILVNRVFSEKARHYYVLEKKSLRHSGSFQIRMDTVISQNIVVDYHSDNIAFVSGVSNKKTLWYFNSNMKEAILIDLPDSLKDEYQIADLSDFSQDGTKLFFRLSQVKKTVPASKISKVHIWSYNDGKLLSQQAEEIGTGTFLSVFKTTDLTIKRLQNKNEIGGVFLGDKSDNTIIFTRYDGDPSEWNWNKASIPYVDIVSTETGERKALYERPFASASPRHTLSPTGRFLIYFDAKLGDWISVNTTSFKKTNLTKAVRNNWNIEEVSDQPYYLNTTYSVAGWSNSDSVVYIYDATDIWRLDLTGNGLPQNLTNGYGKRKSIVFRFAMVSDNQILNERDRIIISAFDRISKYNGFYEVDTRLLKDPRKLTIGPYIYFLPTEFLGFAPIKAKNVESYLVQRQSVRESPNYFLTSDFVNFARITGVFPEKEYNWMTSEVVSFRSYKERKKLQGVLYKPADFDSTKKYPVIFHYYDKMSQLAYKYQKPGSGRGDLDIAWFVSNGYIVFTPDIIYRRGRVGESAFFSVLGAAMHLMSFKWVERSRMGLQGHSFGGYQTNYIITRTGLFSAACSSSGMSDLVSNYLGSLGNHANYDWYENRFMRMGTTLWEDPDAYISNSPVFNLRKVSTPLLTIANRRDRNVPFNQGLELYLGLRRLGKKIWMLQYDEGAHGVGKRIDMEDYLVRMTQFFDYYLKKSLPPRWMVKGLPEAEFGTSNGFDLLQETISDGLIIPSRKKR